MDVFMENVPSHVRSAQIKIEVARAIHKPEYLMDSAAPFNLEVTIFQRARRNGTKCGVVTFPYETVARQFLREYGLPSPISSIFVGGRLLFKSSNKPPRTHIVEEIRRTPYLDPRVAEEREAQTTELNAKVVGINGIQFGWECRDNVFSVEWEKECTNRGTLTYDHDRREFRVKVNDSDCMRIVAIRAAQIVWASAGEDDQGKHVLCLSLGYPPVFETDGSSTGETKRKRHSCMHPSHAVSAPYTSTTLQLICQNAPDLRSFRSLCNAAHVKLDNQVCPVQFRGLFSEEIQRNFTQWLSRLSWRVAFQIEALARNLLADVTELLDLRGRIERMVSDKGEPYAIAFLRYFATEAKAWLWYDEDEHNDVASMEAFFTHCANNFVFSSNTRLQSGIDPENLFDCLHVTITPSSLHLDGPFPERSNRVMRSYPSNHDSFLRVSFVDESNLQFRVDREVDGRDFIRKRFGNILLEGLNIGGRHFRFLAYSQSALKEHAVWFVKEFRTPDGRIINAASIIASLGDFSQPDPRLVFCPARYAARISQAFTATDASASAEVDEIFLVDDVSDDTGRWCFTDGVGTISAELARAIWKELRDKRRRAKRASTYPRAFQVRFQGSKGMLSVDYRLTGRAICLRPSMIKFTAPDSRVIEIARAFDKPGPFYLNRPLIMILEELGVPYETFKDLQEAAVSEAQESVQSLGRAGKLLETYGLGNSFKMTSVMLSLEKLGVQPPMDDEFFQRMMDFSVNHVLRELKHHARIPVKDAWNLVGVADVHGFLEEGEVFIHVVPTNGQAPFYFEGRTLVTRSPTIHPGDVQIARAIGRPPPGSPFERETLRNCVVFSIKGNRPLPTCLGGGDLDGDIYCCTMLESLMPTRTYPPAKYSPAQKVLLDRPSTMEDVANFVTEYIYSDSLGLIAMQWLIIADQSSLGPRDPDCLLLSELHSDAVDYPKSGRPVPVERIPKLKHRLRPDWNAPETLVEGSKLAEKFYESSRAIGRLFRAIDLPASQTVQTAQRAQRRRLREGSASLQDILEGFHAAEPVEDDEVSLAVYDRVTQFIAVGRHPDDIIVELWELFEQYASQLRTICADHTVSNSRDAMLTEEEAVVGTIVAKSSQPRKRKDNMSKMRERTAPLVQGVGQQIEGDEGILLERSLERAWVAFHIANLEQDSFGAKSFAWIALGEIFDAIKKIEESEGYF